MDFKKFYDEVLKATRKSIKELSKNKDIYAFAISTDHYYDTFGITVNTTTALEEQLKIVEDPTDKNYKYYPPEWTAWKEFEYYPKHLSDISKKLKGSDIEDKDVFYAHEQNFQNTCIEVMKELKFNGEFDKHFKNPIFITFDIGCSEVPVKKLRDLVILLNHDNEYKDDFLAWMKTWNV